MIIDREILKRLGFTDKAIDESVAGSEKFEELVRESTQLWEQARWSIVQDINANLIRTSILRIVVEAIHANDEDETVWKSIRKTSVRLVARFRSKRQARAVKEKEVQRLKLHIGQCMECQHLLCIRVGRLRDPAAYYPDSLFQILANKPQWRESPFAKPLEKE